MSVIEAKPNQISMKTTTSNIWEISVIESPGVLISYRFYFLQRVCNQTRPIPVSIMLRKIILLFRTYSSKIAKYLPHSGGLIDLNKYSCDKYNWPLNGGRVFRVFIHEEPYKIQVIEKLEWTRYFHVHVLMRLRWF